MNSTQWFCTIKLLGHLFLTTATQRGQQTPTSTENLELPINLTDIFGLWEKAAAPQRSLANSTQKGLILSYSKIQFDETYSRGSQLEALDSDAHCVFYFGMGGTHRQLGTSGSS